MADKNTNRTVRVPLQMVAEWDAVFERARAERAELRGVDPEAVTNREVWAEIMMVLGPRFLLGDAPAAREEISAKLDVVLERLDAIERRNDS